MSDVIVVTEENTLLTVVQPTTVVNIYSNKGLTGNTGQQGIQGIQGPKGDNSTVPGPIGLTGPTGPKGDIGLTGPASTIAGPEGPPGGPTTQYKGTWSASATYVSGDTVTYQGNLYWLQTAASWSLGAVPPSGGFIILLSKGDKGEQGIQGIPGNFSARLLDLTDVNISSIQNDDIIRYSSFSSEWINSGFLDGGNY